MAEANTQMKLWLRAQREKLEASGYVVPTQGGSNTPTKGTLTTEPIGYPIKTQTSPSSVAYPTTNIPGATETAYEPELKKKRKNQKANGSQPEDWHGHIQPKWKWSFDGKEALVWPVDYESGTPHHIDVTSPETFYKLAQGRVYMNSEGDFEILVWQDRGTNAMQKQAVVTINHWLETHQGVKASLVMYQHENVDWRHLGREPTWDEILYGYYGQVPKKKGEDETLTLDTDAEFEQWLREEEKNADEGFEDALKEWYDNLIQGDPNTDVDDWDEQTITYAEMLDVGDIVADYRDQVWEVTGTDGKLTVFKPYGDSARGSLKVAPSVLEDHYKLLTPPGDDNDNEKKKEHHLPKSIHDMTDDEIEWFH